MCFRNTLTYLIAITIISGNNHAATAQNTPPSPPSQMIGMKHLRITPPDFLKELPKESSPPPQASKKIKPVKKPLTQLTMKDSLIPTDKLQKWEKLSLAAYAANKKDLAALQQELEKNKGIIPPQGLFLAAKSLSDMGKMEEAALYFLVGQMRMEFDMARWPATPDKHYKEVEKNNARKSQDQALPNARDPKMENPHFYVGELSSSIGIPIFDWLMKDPERLNKALKKAEEWDLSAPYGYDPGYKTPEPIPFEEWESLLTKSRSSYLKKMRELQSALSNYVGTKK